MTHPSLPARPAVPCYRTGRLLAASLASLLAAAAFAGDSPFDYHASPATLTYTIEISGQAQTGNAAHGEWSKAQVHRKLQGMLHLQGQRQTFAHLDNPGEQIARGERARQAMAGQMPAMEKIADACGDDDECAAAHVMALVNGMSPDARRTLAATAKGPAARTRNHSSGIWSLDGKTACSLRALSEGSTHSRWINDSEGGSGYISGTEERHGQGSSDCLHDPLPVSSAQWDGDSQTLEIALPGLTLTEGWRRSTGETGSRKADIPALQLEHLHWSGKGPQSGQQTRHVQVTTGDRSVPATMTIRWTFTPDRA